MYAQLKDYLNNYNSDIINLILINYYKLSKISFKTSSNQAMILYQTRNYIFQDQEYKDIGLSNIKQIKCSYDAYFAVSYDNELFVWVKILFLIATLLIQL